MITLRDALSQYVAVRRALGTELREPAMTLGYFVEFMERQGVKYITTEIAIRWACMPKGVQRATWARRLSMVRRFAAWLSAIDPRNEIPPKRILPARHRRTKPYIFTDQEVEQLMAEAARLPSPTGLRALTYVSLIGLLASTGLRPGEALALDMSDVNLESGILTIRKTKFGKTRFVPVVDSTRTALADYAKQRDRIRRRRETDAFLVCERGTRLHYCTARRTFRSLCYAIGLRASAGSWRDGSRPRLQAFRHTFATRKLVEWYRAGLDVEREMPKLMTFLGHVALANTYWYIEAVPELLQLATQYLTTQKRGGAR